MPQSPTNRLKCVPVSCHSGRCRCVRKRNWYQVTKGAINLMCLNENDYKSIATLATLWELLGGWKIERKLHYWRNGGTRPKASLFFFSFYFVFFLLRHRNNLFYIALECVTWPNICQCRLQTTVNSWRHSCCWHGLSHLLHGRPS